MTGEFEHLPGGINGNGIVASADGTTLIIAHTDLGKLYTVDAATAKPQSSALDGEVEIYHDGLVLAGDTLYIVNYNDKIYEIALAPRLDVRHTRAHRHHRMLEAPATAAIYDDALYVVNAAGHGADVRYGVLADPTQAVALNAVTKRKRNERNPARWHSFSFLCFAQNLYWSTTSWNL